MKIAAFLPRLGRGLPCLLTLSCFLGLAAVPALAQEAPPPVTVPTGTSSVAPASAPPISAPAIETAGIPAVALRGDLNLLRETPDGKVILRLKKGTPFSVFERTGEYYHVTLRDGTRGWLHEHSVGIDPAGVPTVAAPAVVVAPVVVETPVVVGAPVVITQTRIIHEASRHPHVRAVHVVHVHRVVVHRTIVHHTVVHRGTVIHAPMMMSRPPIHRR